MKNKIMNPGEDIFSKKYDFGGRRSEKLQYFIVEFEVLSHASSGKRKNIDLYKLYITREANKYTCKKMDFQHNDNPEVSVPSLAGWSYNLDAKLLNKDGVSLNSNSEISLRDVALNFSLSGNITRIMRLRSLADFSTQIVLRTTSHNPHVKRKIRKL
jgi:hypothetical protein